MALCCASLRHRKCPTLSWKLWFVGGGPKENFFQRVVLCCRDVTLWGQFFGGEMETNKSALDKPTGETHQWNLKHLTHINSLNFAATCRPLGHQVQFCTNIYSFLPQYLRWWRYPHDCSRKSSARSSSTSCRWTSVTAAHPPELSPVNQHCWAVVYTIASSGHDDRKCSRPGLQKREFSRITAANDYVDDDFKTGP